MKGVNGLMLKVSRETGGAMGHIVDGGGTVSEVTGSFEVR